jgi:hypothetical protein
MYIHTTQYNENDFGRISGFALPLVMSPTAKLRLPGHPGILVTLPDESRYGENRGIRSDTRLSSVHQGPERGRGSTRP